MQKTQMPQVVLNKKTKEKDGHIFQLAGNKKRRKDIKENFSCDFKIK